MPTPKKPSSPSRPPTAAESALENAGIAAESSLDDLPPMPGADKPPATLAFPETQTGSGTDTPLHIPGYEMLGELGRGGMGVVYKARQLQLGRLVALKMSRSGDMNAEELSRFRAEAEAVARLHHPNIVQIFEVGECQGRPYFAFEYVEGGSLADFLRGMPQPARSSGELVETLARAMHVAHQQGIIHRDLKPANILLGGARDAGSGTRGAGREERDAGSAAKIADFGVAKRIDKHSMQTATGAVLGTPNYMAPEQAWGSDKRRPVGPPADVYALGAILYEMITGRPPFLGETPLDTLQQVVMQEPVAPTRLQPKVPKDLETICLKCLQKEPVRRYASAEALADDLRRFLDDLPIEAKPAGPITRLLRWRRRNPAVAALLVLVLLVLVAGIGVSTYFAIEATFAADAARISAHQAEKNEQTAEEMARQAKRNEKAADDNARRANDNLEIAKVNLKKAEDNFKLAQQRLRERERLQYDWQISLANRALLEKNLGRALELLDGLIPGHTDSEDLRAFEWYHMRQRCGAKAVTLTKAHDGPILALACSPDGNLVATGPAWQNNQTPADGFEIRLRDTQSGRLLVKLRGHTKSINGLAFTSDGKRLASASDDGTIMVWDPTKEAGPLATYRGHEAEVTGVQYSPDGWLLVSSSADKSVRVWDTRTNKVVSVLSDMPDAVEWVAFHPSGDAVAGACRDGTIIVWDTNRFQVLARFPGYGRRRVVHLAWNSKSKQLASASPDGTIQLWDVAANNMAAPMRDHFGPVNQVAFSPDGTSLVSVSDDKTLRLFNAASQTQLKAYTDHAAAVRCLAFNADGTLLASGSMDGTVILRPFSIKTAAISLKGHAAGVHDVAWNADGTLLASSRGIKDDQEDPAAGSEVILWNMVTNRPNQTLTGHAKRVYRVAFQPKGKVIATASQDGTIRLWDASSGNELKQLSKQDQPYCAIAWSHDGNRLAATCDFVEAGKALTRVTIWDVNTGNQVQAFQDSHDWMDSLAWSGDGKWLAGGSSEANAIRLWNADTGVLVHLFKGHTSPIHGLAFSPDSLCLASASADKSVRVWDVTEKKEQHVFKGHGGAVLAVAFHPNGKRLASGSDDNLVKLWDLDTRQEIYTMPGHTKPVTALAFRPDGHQLATSSRDMTVRIWEATPLPEDTAAAIKK